MEEALRSEMEVDHSEWHRECASVRERNFEITFDDRFMLRLDVGGDDVQLGEPVTKKRQMLANPRDRLLGTQDETEHDGAVRRHAHQDVLELAGAVRNIVRTKTGAGDERRNGRQARPNIRLKDAAAAKIDTATLPIENSERRILHRPSDDHLRFIAEPRFRSRHSRLPTQWTERGEKVRARALFSSHLRCVVGTHEAARSAGAGIEIGALHHVEFTWAVVASPHERIGGIVRGAE